MAFTKAEKAAINDLHLLFTTARYDAVEASEEGKIRALLKASERFDRVREPCRYFVHPSGFAGGVAYIRIDPNHKGGFIVFENGDEIVTNRHTREGMVKSVERGAMKEITEQEARKLAKVTSTRFNLRKARTA